MNLLCFFFCKNTVSLIHFIFSKIFLWSHSIHTEFSVFFCRMQHFIKIPLFKLYLHPYIVRLLTKSYSNFISKFLPNVPNYAFFLILLIGLKMMTFFCYRLLLSWIKGGYVWCLFCTSISGGYHSNMNSCNFQVSLTRHYDFYMIFKIVSCQEVTQ